MSDEQTDLILGKARNAIQPSASRLTFNDAAPLMEEITNERLLAAYEVLASIISVHGDQYLPLFKRLHTEIENRKKNDEYVKLAKTIHGQRLEP